MASIVPIDANKPEPGSVLDYALKYAAIGWRIIPCWWVEGDQCACGKPECKSKGKHPIGALAPFGQNSATTDPGTIRKWWARYPKANVAVYLEPSGLCAVDVDPRNGGLDTMDVLEARHGKLDSDLYQFSGGGGFHLICQAPVSGHLPGKIGPGVDLKQNGYILLEPSNHLSGRLYAWEASSSPLEGCVASPLPDWIRDLASTTFVVKEDSAPVARCPISEEEIGQLEDAVRFIPADERDTWLNVGFALHNDLGGQRGFSIWDTWSQASSKYDPVDQTRVWRSFKVKGLSGVTKATIFELAQRGGWLNPGPVAQVAAAVPVESVSVKKAPEPEAFNFTLPGVLGQVEAWINSTSRKPQPAFATQAALAFGATVMGRRFVTTQRNWPSLYFINIGKSASGKEHAKWAVESLLEACNLSKLIGPASYTSNSGVLSALHAQPSHVSIIDEFGKVLEAASVKNSARAYSAMTMLMEVWARADGTARPQGYSTFGMSKADAEKLTARSVRNPSLTVLAMTTPETFFETIGSAAARDGFLNRFLTVESDIGRQVGQHVNQCPVPESVIEWASEIHAVNTMADIDQPADMAATPKVIPFSKAALEVFRAFEHECVGLMDIFEADGLAEMFGRSNEIAMKMSLILAVGCGRNEIDQKDADSSIRYVRHHAMRTVERLKTTVADSEFQGVKKQVLACIFKAGEKGMTERELSKASRKFDAMDQRGQLNVLNSLAFAGDIQRVEFPSQSGRGSARKAWVAIDGDKTPT